MNTPDTDLEQHYTPQQLADAWAVSVSYIRQRFRLERGVVRLGRTLRIPAGVADRVYLESCPQPLPKRTKTVARRAADGGVVFRPR